MPAARFLLQCPIEQVFTRMDIGVVRQGKFDDGVFLLFAEQDAEGGILAWCLFFIISIDPDFSATTSSRESTPRSWQMIARSLWPPSCQRKKDTFLQRHRQQLQKAAQQTGLSSVPP
jgi:hypothetical protein